VEIGLCPHLRIYPRTKLATPLGTHPLVIFGFLILCGHLLLLPFSSDL
jgi:hypothetical protein